MKEPLDEVYLKWLYDQVNARRRPPTYWTLLRQMLKKEFIWYVPNDDNRAEDGRLLRYEFIEDLGLEDIDPDWMALGCSVLEMLVGLSRRLSFFTEREPRDWFWELVDNLGLRFDDRNPMSHDQVEEVLNRFIWRTYSKNGSGGLFPLRHPERDQREVELWYQLSQYLRENA